MASARIEVRGATQNTLKSVDVDFPVGEVTAVTGVAGAGKTSLAFDVLYAEGYRRYVETFSAYARQTWTASPTQGYEAVSGVLLAVAIDRTAPVRTSRSTVGTMTSVADYERALFPRVAKLHCDICGNVVERSSPDKVWDALMSRVAAGVEKDGNDGDHPGRGWFFSPTGSLEPQVLRDALGAAGFRRCWNTAKRCRLVVRN